MSSLSQSPQIGSPGGNFSVCQIIELSIIFKGFSFKQNISVCLLMVMVQDEIDKIVHYINNIKGEDK